MQTKIEIEGDNPIGIKSYLILNDENLNSRDFIELFIEDVNIDRDSDKYEKNQTIQKRFIGNLLLDDISAALEGFLKKRKLDRKFEQYAKFMN